MWVLPGDSPKKSGSRKKMSFPHANGSLFTEMLFGEEEVEQAYYCNFFSVSPCVNQGRKAGEAVGACRMLWLRIPSSMSLSLTWKGHSSHWQVLWGSATVLGNGNISWTNGDLFWVAGKSNISKFGSVRTTGCFCASLESPSRETGSTAKSQAALEPQARGQAGEEGGSPALHLWFSSYPCYCWAVVG